MVGEFLCFIGLHRWGGPTWYMSTMNRYEYCTRCSKGRIAKVKR